MAYAYFQNQAAFDAYHNAVCADISIPKPGYILSTNEPAITAQWTEAFVEPIQIKNQGNVTTWAAHIPDAHQTQYDAQLGTVIPDSEVVFGTGPPPGNGIAQGTVRVLGQLYIIDPNTLVYKKAKPSTWTDPNTNITYNAVTGEVIP